MCVGFYLYNVVFSLAVSCPDKPGSRRVTGREWRTSWPKKIHPCLSSWLLCKYIEGLLVLIIILPVINTPGYNALTTLLNPPPYPFNPTIPVFHSTCFNPCSYLLNPYSILTCAGFSTVSLSTLAVAWALWMRIKGT